MIYEIDSIHKKRHITISNNQPVKILRLSDDTNNIYVYLVECYMIKTEYEMHKDCTSPLQ